MYNFFKDNIAFFFSNSTDINELECTIYITKDKIKKIPQIINELIKENKYNNIIFKCEHLEQTIEFIECFYPIKIACGGWVFNEKNQLLIIERNNKWDIPKGHLEKNESYEECAIREVKEETSISHINIIKKYGISRHIYKYEGNYVLKITHWYKMFSNNYGQLQAQTDEGITNVKWANNEDIETYLSNGWNSIFYFYNNSIKVND